MRLWDAATGEPCATLPHPTLVWDAGLRPRRNLAGDGVHRDDRLRIWDVATARVRKEIPLPDKALPLADCQSRRNQSGRDDVRPRTTTRGT